jgi:Mg2+-importing ATPase
MTQELPTFCDVTAEATIANLGSSSTGMTSPQAALRLSEVREKSGRSGKPASTLFLLLGQFKSPIILILLAAVVLSFFLGDVINAAIILGIVVMSGLLGFWQEQGAADAVQKLLAIIQVKVTVLRDGKPIEVPAETIVPGDVVLLNAGNVVPGDGLLLESNSLFVNEAALTGETFPVEKTMGVLPADTPLNKRTNTLFTGTYATSGTAKVLIVRTGSETEFGRVSESLRLRPPETDFEHGIRHFGLLLMQLTMLMVFAIFAINMFLHRPVLSSFLFALALAVGLTPQLLPAIISVNLSHGAKKMADAKVIVKRLASIENFGSMDILCSDKTGTLTLGEVQLNSGVNVEGGKCEKTVLYAQINAFFQTGYTNPIDQAILAYQPVDLSAYSKLGEQPYDFVRKRLSILVSKGDTHLMVSKGALSNILEVCSKAETATGTVVELSALQTQIQAQFEELSAKGFRVIGVAYRDVGVLAKIGKDDENEMTFLGFLALFDPIKEGIVGTIQTLNKLGITLKVITGDNRLVAANVAGQVGLSATKILSGPDLQKMSPDALRARVDNVDIFAEIEPNQKERLIIALKQAGHVVGYIGDGINDASALHVADVGISVANAVDVAKEAADIVLLEKNLAVLESGVREGRITFGNTLKYVFMATSANFGNMFSMAGASLILPFLPLLPTQILLTNLLTDFPEMTIATDSVDPEMVDRPRRWDIGFIRRFMMIFGLVSSIFDYLTFGVLLLLLKANPEQFRTGWFVESVISASIIVLVIRTRRPFFKSRPGKYLMIATFLIVVSVLILPYTPIAHLFGFTPVAPIFLIALALILASYILLAEVAKVFFYRSEARRAVPTARH